MINAFLNAFLLQVILFEALTALLSDANTSIYPNYASFWNYYSDLMKNSFQYSSSGS